MMNCCIGPCDFRTLHCLFMTLNFAMKVLKCVAAMMLCASATVRVSIKFVISTVLHELSQVH